MDWPEYIPMGRLRVPLENVPGESEVLRGNDGMCEWSSPWPRITYSDEIADDDYRDLTIAHEIVHGWLFQSGISNVLKDNMQEAICDAVAPFLIQLLEEIKDA
jgi:Zn-dependent peptidase ImmA (M78 family)